MNYSNQTSTDIPYKPTMAAITFQACVLVIVCLLTVLGNTFVAAVVKLDRRLHKPTFYFLLNLAVADFMSGMFYTPFYTASVIQQKWIFGESWCRGHVFVISTSFNASLATLCVVSIDRFLDITDPLR